MNHTPHQVMHWLPAVCWCGFIYWLSSRSHVEPGGLPLPPHSDKLVHLLLFGILSLLFYFPLKGNGLRPVMCGLIAIMLAAAYGITDELHQLHVPGRKADLADWLADLAGASLVMFLARTDQKRYSERQPL